jgi:uncharacterized protein YkwD
MYRYSGDFVPECKTFGTKQGLPIIRLFTRSVAAAQLKRTVYGPLLVVFVLSVVAFSGAVTGTISDPDPHDALDTASSLNSSQVSGLGEIADNEDFDQAEARQALVEEVNDERKKRGLSPIEQSSELQQTALQHSKEMVERDFFAHTTPDGVTANQRIRRTSLQCQQTGENLAQNYWNEQVVDQQYIETNEELAEVIVQQWIDSPPHRENLFRPSWDYVGHGISFDGDKFYVTQNFCGR